MTAPPLRGLAAAASVVAAGEAGLHEDSWTAFRAGATSAEPDPEWDPLEVREASRAEVEAAARDDRPIVHLERRGPSYRVVAPEVGLEMVFRDVRTSGELTADVSIGIGGRHLFRSTTTLSITARDRLAKTTAGFAQSDGVATRRALYAIVESVLSAEDEIDHPVDLRTASLALPAGGLHVVRPLWPAGSAILVAPGEAGKSTIARAVAVSIAAGIGVIPGISPVGSPRPVLYVAGEDSIALWHARSVEAICRGLGIDRSLLAQPIELFDARGRPLHRIARSIAERAADFGCIVLDSQQSLLPQADAFGGIRDRDTEFWRAVDQSDRPTLVIAHPNRADSKDWAKADGRIAGSEVNRDRTRMAWLAQWRDEPAVAGKSFRRYRLVNVKGNHAPTEPELSFAASWRFGVGDADPGTLWFVSADPLRPTVKLSPELTETLVAYRAGATTPTPLAEALGIKYETAKSRLRLLGERDLLDGSNDPV